MINGSRIFWDLDGVLRRLSFPNYPNWPDSWTQRDGSGNDICEVIDKNLEILLESPETEYIELARECVPLHIVSSQPDNWRKHTSKWLDVHLPEAKVKYVSNAFQKLVYLEAKTRVLIEDYPLYPSYENIILISRPYNRNTKAEHRVTYPDELRDKISQYIKGDLVWNQ
jgi:hypothetical protein